MLLEFETNQVGVRTAREDSGFIERALYAVNETRIITDGTNPQQA